MPEPAIALQGVERRYGERVALSGVEVELAAGDTLRGAGRQRRGQDHPAARAGHAAATTRGQRDRDGGEPAGRCVEGARTAGLPGPRPAAVPRAQRPPEPGLPRTAARSSGRPGGRAAGRRGHGAARGQPRARALARHGPAHRRRAGDPARSRAVAAGRAARGAGPRRGRVAGAADRPRLGAHAGTDQPRRGGRAGRVRPGAGPGRRPAGVREGGRRGRPGRGAGLYS